MASRSAAGMLLALAGARLGRAAPPLVGAYIPEYRLDGLDLRAAASLGLTDGYVFSLTPTPLGEPDGAGIGARLAVAATTLRAAGARAHVVVGGAGRTSALAGLAAADAPRRAFARRLARYAVAAGFDGVVLDWPAPPAAPHGAAARAAEHTRAAAAHTPLAALVRDVRAALREAAQQAHAQAPAVPARALSVGITLSIADLPQFAAAAAAAAADGSASPSTDGAPRGRASRRTWPSPPALLALGFDADALRLADYVHLMAYDDWRDPEGHASAAGAFSRAEAVLRAGVRPPSLLLGVPFFARRLGARGFGEVRAYAQIATDALAAGQFNEADDHAAETPFVPVRTGADGADRADGADGAQSVRPYAFNGRATVAAKARWAAARGLGGTFGWELGHDLLGLPEASLVAAMAAGARSATGGADEASAAYRAALDGTVRPAPAAGGGRSASRTLSGA
ncbi:hypothetical protein KFE25_007633 [Diacronema lutheri]|uniref:Chitinase II/V-like catalytic domain-containing protein n=2 Tax=Diacronema lutheri TaxID=2081491 RepID=A0A8J6CGH2_DIALT|nr:hypothetical protein KFE25_007633 [Diacronema lutheri]